MTPSVSACVIARDDAHQIRRCLASLAWVDECIVVVDERSGDATESIARELGARVLRHTYAGNVEQKNFALDRAKGEWVLFLDADEALSTESIRRIRDGLATRVEGVDGFELGRVTFHLGRWIRHGDFHPDRQLRLFRRGSGRRARLLDLVLRAAAVRRRAERHFSRDCLASETERLYRSLDREA